MTVVDRFLDAITSATIANAHLWTDTATLDATLPNWRMQLAGAASIRDELGRWYADPGVFEELSRAPMDGGEVVQFLLTWTEHGVPHAAHQAHVIRVTDDLIGDHAAYCGGRWPAGLLAEMAEAARA